MRNPRPPLKVVLNSPEYLMLFSQLLHGKTYSSEIAQILKKKQNTVSEQLYALEKHGLIKRSKRDLAQHFEINWEGRLEPEMIQYLYGNSAVLDELRDAEFRFLATKLFEHSFRELHQKYMQTPGKLPGKPSMKFPTLSFFIREADNAVDEFLTRLATEKEPNLRKTKLWHVLKDYKETPEPISPEIIKIVEEAIKSCEGLDIRVD